VSNGITAGDVLRGIDLDSVPIAVLADMQTAIAEAIKVNLAAASGRMWSTYSPRTVNVTPDDSTSVLPVAGGLFDDRPAGNAP
jgi:hypothetical protein